MNSVLSAATSVALAAVLLAGAVETASAAVRISAASSAFAGDLLDVQLLVDSAPGGSSDSLAGLGGFDNGTFTLSFDPDVLEIPPGNSLHLLALLPTPLLIQPAETFSSMSLALLYLSPLPDSTPLGVIASGQLGVKTAARTGPTELTLRVEFNGGESEFNEETNPLARTFQTSHTVVLVPEPAGWMMLLIGLAVIGLISRQATRGPSRPADRIADP